MLKHPIGRVRASGLIEGVSFLLLLGVAMPLKYLAGRPEAVLVVGWIHGVLFIVYCLAIALAVVQARLTLRLAGLAFLAALVPFGPFLIDARLRREEVGGAGASAPAGG